jgi:hypothetical protein
MSLLFHNHFADLISKSMVKIHLLEAMSHLMVSFKFSLSMPRRHIGGEV